MTFEQLLLLSPSTLVNMTDDQIREVLTPYMPTCRPPDRPLQKENTVVKVSERGSLGQAKPKVPVNTRRNDINKAMELLELFEKRAANDPKLKL